jgi:hypothetical protein
LLDAARRGDVDTLAVVLDQHPDLINIRGTLAGTTGLRTALHFGIVHQPVVRLLLERGGDPTVLDEGDAAYPIHFAASNGELAVVKLLIEHGADPIGSGTHHELDVLGWVVCFDDVMARRRRPISPCPRREVFAVHRSRDGRRRRAPRCHRQRASISINGWMQRTIAGLRCIWR